MELTMIRLLKVLLPLMATLSANASKVEIGIHKLNDISALILPRVMEHLNDPIIIANQEMEECEKIKIKCQIKNIKIRPNWQSEENKYGLEFAKDNKLLYALDLPKAQASGDFIIKGKILGVKYDAKLKIILKGLKTFPKEPVILPGFSGAGVLQFSSNQNEIQISDHLSALNLKVKEIEIVPLDSLGKAALKILSKVVDVKDKSKNLINNRLAVFLNSLKYKKIITKEFEQLFQSLDHVIDPVESFGFDLISSESNLTTKDYLGTVSSELKINSKLAPHQCASKLLGFNIFIINENKTNNFAFIKMESQFLGDIFFKLAKYPHIREEELKNPFLCQKGTERVQLGAFKMPLNWSIKPINKINYFFDESLNQVILKIDLELEAKSAKKWPKLFLYREKKSAQNIKKKIKSALGTVKIVYSLVKREDGLFLELTSNEIEKINGKARIVLLGRSIGPSLKLTKRKKMLEDIFFKEFLENYKEIKISKTEVEIFQGVFFSFDTFKLSGGKLNFKGRFIGNE